MNFKESNKSRLKREGKKLKELVSYLGMTDSNYYANMKNESWKLHQLKKMATFFGCSLSDLLSETALPESKPLFDPREEIYGEAEDMRHLKKEIDYLRQLNTSLVEMLQKQEGKK